jgi:hypothetical protein
MQSVKERENFNYDGDDNQWTATPEHLSKIWKISASIAYLKMKRDIISLDECKDVEYLDAATKKEDVLEDATMEKIDDVKSPRRMELQSVCESLERTRRELRLLQQGHENEMQYLEAELSKMYMFDSHDEEVLLNSNCPSDEFREDREHDRHITVDDDDDELRNKRCNYSFFDSPSERTMSDDDVDKEETAEYSDAESDTSSRHGSRSDDAESRLSEEMTTSHGDRSEHLCTDDDDAATMNDLNHSYKNNEVDVFERIRQSSTSYSTTYTIDDIKQQNRLSHKLKLEAEAESMLRALGITDSESKVSLFRYDDDDDDDDDDGELSEKGYIPADDDSTLNSYVDTSCYNTDGEEMTIVTGCDTEFQSHSINNSNDNCDASCISDEDEVVCTGSETFANTETVTTFEVGNSTSSLTNRNEEKTEKTDLDTRSCGLTDACFTFFSFTTEAAKDSHTEIKQDEGCTDDTSIADSSKSSQETTTGEEEAELAHFAATTSIFAIEAVKSKRISQHVNHTNINISRSSEKSKNQDTELAHFAATTSIFVDVSRTLSVDECVNQAASNDGDVSKSLSSILVDDKRVNEEAASNEERLDDESSCGGTEQSSNEKILADDITSYSSSEILE